MLVFIVSICHSHAYGTAADTIARPSKRQLLRDTVLGPNKADLLDVVKILIGIKKDPFHKKKVIPPGGPFYNIYPYAGYTQATGWTGSAIFNIAFRPKGNKDGPLSYLNNQFQYSQYSQIILVSISTFYTNNNKWQFPGDIRFFHFPTTTYGIGSSTLVSDGENINFFHLRTYRSAMYRAAPGIFIGPGYNLDYHWKVTDDAVRKGLSDDFVKYGYSTTSTSTGPSLNFIYDTRDNIDQTITGAYVNIQFSSHIKALGSTSSWNSLLIDMRRFVPLTRSWYTGLAFWGYIWLTLDGHPPYLDLPSVGWDAYNSTGREYPIGRYTGLNMLYLESEFRFNILRNGLLGGVVFGNLETFTELSGSFFGPIQPGGGAGIRVKFNKNTNSNGCLDYGRGSHHSGGFAGNVNEFF